MKWVPVEGRDARLTALDFGGEGPGALLLHGLAGTALEWDETASWLRESHRVLGLDQRGHGHSERRPEDVSPSAFVSDALTAIERLNLAPTLLVGQSLGGLIAFLAASKRPDLVSALIVVEATPTREAQRSLNRLPITSTHGRSRSPPTTMPSHSSAGRA